MEETSGELDGLVNLVGGFSMGSLSKTNKEKMKTSFDKHVITVFHAIKATVKFLSKGGGGSVVNFSSRRALENNKGALSYNIGKTGVASLTQSLNNELDEIRINALAPDIMDTPANRKAMPKANRENWTSLSEVANLVEFLLSDRSKPVNGQIIQV